MGEPMTERELDEIRARLRSWPEAGAIPAMQANMDRLRLVAEVERLCMELSKCSESNDSLSLQYHEARERWRETVERQRVEVESAHAAWESNESICRENEQLRISEASLVTQVNAMRPIVRVVAERWNELTRTGLYNLAEQARAFLASAEESEAGE